MRFTVSKTALADALSWVARSLPARPTQPVLAGVRITTEGGTARFSAYDYENSAEYTLDVDTAETGEVLVHGRLLSDIIKALPNREVAIFTDGTKVRVQSGASKFTVQTMPMGDYPALPSMPPRIGTVDGSVFVSAARQASVAAGRDEALPVLSAVRVAFDVAAATITMTATDRYRLGKRIVSFDPAPGAVDTVVLIPARALDGYAKALSAVPVVTLHAGPDISTFAVSAGSRHGGTRLLDGDYPKTDAIFPPAFATEAVVNVAELAAAVKRAGLVAERNTPCRLAFEGDTLTVSAGSDDDHFASEQVSIVEMTGDDLSIAFNFGYLTDGLGGITEGQVRFLMVTPQRPAVLRPAQDTVASSSYLIMPVRDTR